MPTSVRRMTRFAMYVNPLRGSGGSKGKRTLFVAVYSVRAAAPLYASKLLVKRGCISCGAML